MSVDSFKYQASPKDEDILVNVRGDSAEEFETNLLNFPHAAYAQFKSSFRGGAALSTVVAPGQQQASQPAAAPAQAAPTWAAAPPAAPSGPVNGSPHPEGKLCSSCGAGVVYKAIRSKAGKDLQLWTCPNQRERGDGHASEFIN